MNALLAQVQGAALQDQSKAEAGGFKVEIAPAGATPARFIGYVELGKRPQEFEGTKKADAPEVLLVFELNGPKHKRDVVVDGVTKVFTNRITIQTSIKLNEKAAFYKLFQAMRYGRDGITHMAQMLGEAFLVTVVHKKSKDGKKTYANLRDDNGWTVRAPRYQADPLDDTSWKDLPCDAPTQSLQLLLWDNPTKEQWDSIFVDGTRTVKRKNDAGEEIEVEESRNWLQSSIVHNATNFEGSPLQDLLSGLGGLDLEPVGNPGDSEDAEEARETPSEAPAADPVPAQEKPKEAAPAPAPAPQSAPPASPAAAQSADDVLASLGL